MNDGGQSGGTESERPAAGIPETAESDLGELQTRIEELQRSVERLGREDLPPPAYASPGAAEQAAGNGATAGQPAALAIGPIAGLVELRLLEEGLERLGGVATATTRRFGHGWARIEIGLLPGAGLERELSGLGRPIRLMPGADEILVARFTDAGAPAESGPPPAVLAATRSAEGIPAQEPGPIDPVTTLLPEPVCRHFRVAPVEFDGTTLTLAMADPADRLAQSVAAALSGARVIVITAGEDQLAAAIERRFGRAYLPAAPLEPDGTAAIADRVGVPLIDLDGIDPGGEALELVPREIQREVPCLPLEVDDTSLYLAICEPLDDEVAELLSSLAEGRRIRAYLAPRPALEAHLERVHAQRPPVLQSLPPTAFPGRSDRPPARGPRALAAAIWAFLLAPVPIGVALLTVAVLVYLFA